MTTEIQSQPQTAAIAYDGGLTCAIGVTSLDRSIPWYTDILGMTLLYRRDDIAWAELATSVDKVTIGLSENETVPVGGGATLTFGVQDIHAAQAALDAAGVRQDGDITEVPDMVRFHTFYDPDGNALMFYQDLGGG